MALEVKGGKWELGKEYFNICRYHEVKRLKSGSEFESGGLSGMKVEMECKLNQSKGCSGDDVSVNGG